MQHVLYYTQSVSFSSFHVSLLYIWYIFVVRSHLVHVISSLCWALCCACWCAAGAISYTHVLLRLLLLLCIWCCHLLHRRSVLLMMTDVRELLYISHIIIIIIRVKLETLQLSSSHHSARSHSHPRKIRESFHSTFCEPVIFILALCDQLSGWLSVCILCIYIHLSAYHIYNIFAVTFIVRCAGWHTIILRRLIAVFNNEYIVRVCWW